RTQRLHGKDYVKACKKMIRKKGEYIPQKFHHTTLAHEIDPERISMHEKEFLQETNFADKVFSLTPEILNGLIAAGMNTDFMFDLSKEEYDIIKQVGVPTFILGRSGTGKTTCLAFKLLRNYMA